MQTATYRVVHTTTYNYETPVRVCHNLVMLTPRGDWMVRTLNHRVKIRPHPKIVNRREDYFGNHLHAFSIEESHRQLVVSAQGHVEIVIEDLPDPADTPPWETVRDTVKSQSDPRWLEACQYRFRSPRVVPDAEFRAYGQQSFTAGRPVLQAAIDLTKRIYRDFRYDTQATHVHTPTREAFQMQRGVCQDFAHVQIACIRSLGLSARYVSGYLRTHPTPGKEKLVGADQSHAWISLYCGRQLGWVDLDPTNNRICNTDHIPIAWGRDYDDVVPIRGVFLGGGKHQITVSVDVSED